MKKRFLPLLLCAAMLCALFSLTACDEEWIADVADLALAVIENLPEESIETAALRETRSVVSLPETARPTAPPMTDVPETEAPVPLLDENGSYDDRDHVALYIHTYGKLPPNYITKQEAEDLGWEGGSVERYAEGKCIGGSKFGNYEGILPTKKGRQYYECDIDTLGEKSRGAKRIVYSNDGLIYYTDDHYETFDCLYGEDAS